MSELNLPKKLKMKVIAKTNLVGDYWLVGMKSDPGLDYAAGQYISVLVNDEGERRSYSIASAPAREGVELLVDVSPMGLGSRFFLERKVGDEVEVVGPLGRFVLDKGAVSSLLIATGSGIAPIRGMIWDYLQSGGKGRIKLLWGVRGRNDVFWLEEFGKWQNEWGNFEFEVMMSQPDKDWHGEVGRVDKRIEEMDGTSWEKVYLCGGEEMVEGVRGLLVKSGVSVDRIVWEKFDY